VIYVKKKEIVMDKFEKKMKEALHEMTNGFEVSDEIKEKIKKVIQKEIPGEYIYSLRYEEFIADIIRFCQILYSRNEALEETIQAQQEETKKLEERIAALEKITSQSA